MFLTHLLQNLGVPAAVASGVGIVAMIVRVGVGAKGRPRVAIASKGLLVTITDTLAGVTGCRGGQRRHGSYLA